jgi:hypothetical protein
VSNVLIIFVDSLPYPLLPRMPRLDAVAEKWSIIPGFGYSVNIHAELFAGLLPDDVGYFGEWMYNPPESPGWRMRKLLPALDAIFRPYLMNRGLQFLLTCNYRPGHIIPNIPLRHLDKFAMEGDHLLDEPQAYAYPSLFSEFQQLRLTQIPELPKGERDRHLYEAGLAAIGEAESLFLPLPDLDGIGHSYGIEGEPYNEHLARLDQWVAELAERFLQLHAEGHVFVISDHGMVNVTQGVYLDIEEQVGRMSSSTYLYFSDASLLRVWIFDEQLRAPVHTYLEQFVRGRLVTEGERREYGLTSERFGDFIYVLDEGLAFEPSTFARHKPIGMHGYHPLAPGQQAVAIHYGPCWEGNPPRRMRDVYYMMREALTGTW